jgi:membrane protein
MDQIKAKVLAILPEQLRGPLYGAQILYQDVDRADVFKHASAMAYVTLFSLVPSIAAVFSLVSVFSPFWGSSGELMGKFKGLILENLAQGSGEQAIQYLESFIGNLDVAKIGISGFAGIMVTLILLLRNIERALNQIFHVSKERNLISRFVNFWTFVTLGTFIAGIAVGVLSGFNLNNLNPFGDAGVQHGFFEWLTPKLSAFVFFTLLYKVTPNTFVPIKYASIGAVIAAILFSLASSGYGVFARQFSNYQAIYGALAAVPLFLMWLYLIWLIILLGGVVVSRMMTGFHLEKSDELLKFAAKNSVEKLRNHRLQDAFPFVLLTMIYRCFGQAAGKGLKLNDLRSSLQLPDDWLLESIDVLEQLGLIVRATSAQGDADSQGGSGEFFPAFPANRLKLIDVMNLMHSDAAKWFEAWSPSIQIPHQKLVRNYWNKEFPRGDSTTVQDLLDSLELA